MLCYTNHSQFYIQPRDIIKYSLKNNFKSYTSIISLLYNHEIYLTRLKETIILFIS